MFPTQRITIFSDGCLLTKADCAAARPATGAGQAARHPGAGGVFLGLIGRSRVAVLTDPDVERPSDLDRLVYIPLDPGGA